MAEVAFYQLRTTALEIALAKLLQKALDAGHRVRVVGESVDLVHVRRCVWREPPVLESQAPAAVVATFGRGGRNFQQIHDDHVGAASEQLWR